MPTELTLASRQLLTTEQVAVFARMLGTTPTPRTVSHWAKMGYVEAIVPPSGQRRPVLWSAEDAVCVRVLAVLRSSKCDVRLGSSWIRDVVRPELARGEPALVRVEIQNGSPHLVTPSITKPTLPSSFVELDLAGWLTEARDALTPSSPRTIFQQGVLFEV